MNVDHESGTIIRKLFPSASADFYTRNSSKTTKLERDSGNAPLEKKKVQRRSSQKFLIRVTSIRKRLIDEDNLCEKFAIDLCRYASGGAFGDEASTTKIETCQRKTEKGEQEKTIIQIYLIDNNETIL